jgi:RNA polymerase sigma-70 factor (ECF subfamily)
LTLMWMRSSPVDEPEEGNTGEDALVLRAQSDPEAFADLYQRHFADVYRYCQRRLGHSEAAADATSQVFTQAFAALKRYRGGTFRGWLFTIAHNTTVDATRRRRPQTTLDAAAEIVDGSPNPEDRVMAREAEETLSKLLAQLPPNQRSVVELRLAGLTGQEIATVLNISLSAAKALQFRAYSRLRSLLIDDERRSYVEVLNARR